MILCGAGGNVKSIYDIIFHKNSKLENFIHISTNCLLAGNININKKAQNRNWSNNYIRDKNWKNYIIVAISVIMI